jgi:hypothetical protein
VVRFLRTPTYLRDSRRTEAAVSIGSRGSGEVEDRVRGSAAWAASGQLSGAPEAGRRRASQGIPSAQRSCTPMPGQRKTCGKKSASRTGTLRPHTSPYCSGRGTGLRRRPRVPPVRRGMSDVRSQRHCTAPAYGWRNVDRSSIHPTAWRDYPKRGLSKALKGFGRHEKAGMGRNKPSQRSVGLHCRHLRDISDSLERGFLRSCTSALWSSRKVVGRP